MVACTVLTWFGCASQRSARETDSGDARLARTTHLARAAWDKGSLAQAETLFRQAHRRARELDDAAGLGDAAYNLAAVLIARERLSEASPLLDESLAALERANRPTVDVLLVKAKVAIAEQRPDLALDWLDQVNQAPALLPAQRAQAALLRGEIAQRAKNVEEARRQLTEARKQSVPGNPMLAAGIEKLSGAVALMEGDAAKAALAFDREAELCRHARNPRAMAQALARAGDAFVQAGNPDAGADRLYRAARSCLAQGDVPAARSLIDRGAELAARSQDESLQSRLRELGREAQAVTR